MKISPILISLLICTQPLVYGQEYKFKSAEVNGYPGIQPVNPWTDENKVFNQFDWYGHHGDMVKIMGVNYPWGWAHSIHFYLISNDKYHFRDSWTIEKVEVLAGKKSTIELKVTPLDHYQEEGLYHEGFSVNVSESQLEKLVNTGGIISFESEQISITREHQKYFKAYLDFYKK